MNLHLILVPLIAYLIGSFPTAYLLVKKFTGQDIRKIGSGNVGAMNVIRALKEKSSKLAAAGFLIVLIVDMAKGALAIFLAQKILLGEELGLTGAQAEMAISWTLNHKVKGLPDEEMAKVREK